MGAPESDVVEAAPRSGRSRRPIGEPPPLPREFPRAAWVLLTALLVSASFWLITFFEEGWRVGIWFNEREGVFLRWLADLRTPWATSMFSAINDIGYIWAVPVIGWATIVLLLVAKRLRHVFVFFGALVVVSLIVTFMTTEISRSRPWGVEQLGPWEGFAHPSIPVAQLAAVAVGAAFALFPRGRWRHVIVATGAALVGLFALSRAYLGLEYPTDAIWAWIGGAAITVIAFLVFCPEPVFPVGFQRGRTAHLDLTGTREEAIKRAVSDQLGLTVARLRPFGLADSAGSTPMLLTVPDCDPSCLFGKLYASSHLRSDRWYKLGRTLTYGQLEDEGRFTAVRRLVEREDYLLRVMQDAGVRAPAPYGIATLTPEREYLIVTEFLDGAVELTEAEVDSEVVDDCLSLVRTMWDHGLAHRDVKPSNVMVRDRQGYLIDAAFGQMRPSPWREAVDLANMMLSLALRSTSELVYERALLQFSTDEIAEAFSVTRGVTLPSQLRRELKNDPRDLVAEFRALGPPRPQVPVQRWSPRRLGLTAVVLVVVVAGLVLGVGNLEGIGLL